MINVCRYVCVCVCVCSGTPLGLFYCFCLFLLHEYTITRVRSCAHMQAWLLLIYEITLITKKEKKIYCSCWPKAIKGTLISLAIMLWGILNSVISARYTWRKVSGNCFVLLEQRLSNELTWLSRRFVRCHPPAASPAICILLWVLLSAPVSHSLKLWFSKCWLVWKNKCIVWEKNEVT